MGEGPVVRPWWWRESVKTAIVGESRTQQAHKDTTDVNVILSRYERTGVLPSVKQNGMYADVTGLQGDLTERIMESQSVIATAQEFEREHHTKAKRKASDGVGEPGKAAPGSGGESPGEAKDQAKAQD